MGEDLYEVNLVDAWDIFAATSREEKEHLQRLADLLNLERRA